MRRPGTIQNVARRHGQKYSLTIADVAKLLIFFVIGIFAFVPGRYLGEVYKINVLPELPQFAGSFFFNLFVWGGLAVFISFKIENRYLWCRLLSGYMAAWMDKFNVAPLSMGMAVGFLVGVM